LTTLRTLVLRTFSQVVGGATAIAVTHNLGSLGVWVQVFRNSAPYDTVDCDVERTDVNNVTLRFGTAPAASEYQCMVMVP
jgi:hypothetical protein